MPNKVKERRQELGKTQDWLAGQVGVSRVTINEIENNKTSPRAKIAISISRALGRLCEELFPLDI